ncbi:phage baseplate protein [Buttiauxella brennerae]|uniref:phage baseplate protein n=1 Tax=Buttiauxella brennerae TaxID=82988 RepID=UPI00286F0AC7|nr:hypothetical protein [Buttiauxella brennerae]
MPLETALYIDTLQPDWPLGTDPESQGDDHLRMIKKVLKNTFPNINDPVSGTPAEINNLTTHLKYEPANAGNGNFARVVAVDDAFLTIIGMRAASYTGAVYTAHADLVINWRTVMTLLYPIGHVIMNTGANPGTYLGFGTWEQRAGTIYGYGTTYDVNGLQQNLPRGKLAGFYRIEQKHIAKFDAKVSGSTKTDGGHGHNQPTTDGSGGHFLTNGSLVESQDEYSYESSVTIPATGSAHEHEVDIDIEIGTGASNFFTPGWVFSVWERTA